MNKKLLTLVLAVAAIVGCKKEEPVVPELKIDQSELTIPVAGTETQDVTITFNTNVEWTAKVDGSADWCAITPQKGLSGANTIKVIADENTGKEVRTAVVVITAGETLQSKVTLTQSGKPYLEVESTQAWLDVNGTEISVPVSANVKFTAEAAENDWLKVSADASSIKFSASRNESTDYRSVAVTVKAEGNEALNQEITVFQNGRVSLIWSKIPAKEWEGFTPSEGARMAVVNDYLLVANGGKILVVNPADGAITKTVTLPDGFKAQSLCVDDAGNVLLAANASWNEIPADADMFRIYTVKSVEDTPKLLIEYNSANIWCLQMCNVRVKGDITKNAVITAYASNSAYWMAWEIKDGKIGDLKCNTTPYTSNPNSGCVAPAGTSLSDGLWFIGYGGTNDLNYCADVDANTWVISYVTGISWMENNDVISTVTMGGKTYLALLYSCHFNYDSTDAIILDVTDPKAAKEYVKYAGDYLVNRGDDWSNSDWTGAGYFADACLVEKDGVLYLYFIDVNYGAAACISVQ